MVPGKQYSPEVLLGIAWRRKWSIVLPAIAIATAASVVTYRLPDIYRADTLILVVPQRVPEGYVRSTVTSGFDERLETITEQILSRTRLERIMEDLNLYAEKRKVRPIEDVIEEMRKGVAVEVVRGNAFTVSFYSESPVTAMRVTERLASLFIAENLSDRKVLADGTSQFLDSQLQEARRKLIDNEKKLESYRRHHAGELPTQLEANLQAKNSLEMQLLSLTESIGRDRDRRLVLQRSLTDTEVADSSELARQRTATEAPPAETAADRLAAGEAALEEMLTRLKPEHPDVVLMKRTVADLQKRAAAEERPQPTADPTDAMRRNRLNEIKAELDKVDKEIAGKLEQEKELHLVIASYQGRIEAVPTRESELTELLRDYETLQGLYRDLLVKKQESQIAANLERRQIGEQFRILDPARLPTKPYYPERGRLYLMGLVAAFGVGLALAALLEYRDRTVRTEDDAKVAFNLPVLATVPLMRDARRLHRRRTVLAVSISIVAATIGTAAVVAWKLLK